MSLSNINRDANHLNLDSATSYASASLITATSHVVSKTGGTVDKVVSSTSSESTALTVAAGYVRMIGAYLEPNLLESNPYRIKAYAPYTVDAWVFFGYLNSTISGTDDSFLVQHKIPFKGILDDVFMVPALDSGHPYYADPVCFAVVIGEVANKNILSHISVQNLGVAAPAFSHGVS